MRIVRPLVFAFGLVAALLCSARARADLSVQAGQADRDLSARRQLRPDGARFRAEALRTLGPAGHRREQAGRRRLDRHGVRRAPGARRLHLRHRQHRPGGGQSAALEGALRRRARLRAGVADCDRPQHPGRQPERAGEDAGRARRVCAGESRQAQLRHQRPGQHFASGRRDVQELTAQVDIVHVPYKGGILAVQDLLAGHIQFIFSDALPAMQHHPRGQAARAVRHQRRAQSAHAGDPDLRRIRFARSGGGELVGRAHAGGNAQSRSSTSFTRTWSRSCRTRTSRRSSPTWASTR